MTSAECSPALRDPPIVAEPVVPGFEVSTWSGRFAPAGTSVDIMARLDRKIVVVLTLPDVCERMASAGAEPVGILPQEFRAILAAAIDKWAKLISDAGIQFN